MPVKRFVAALRRAAEVVDVPGAPRSLRLDHVQVDGDSLELVWSIADPEVPPSPESRNGRIRGRLMVRSPRGAPHDVARAWWAQAQLEAARRYKLQVDADWIPGEPLRRRSWTVEQAWEALLTHLGAYGAQVQVESGEIRVTGRGEEAVYRIDPHAWAEYLNATEDVDPSVDTDIVPAATPLVDGLPVWVTDELFEVTGAWGPVVELIDHRLVGRGDASDSG